MLRLAQRRPPVRLCPQPPRAHIVQLRYAHAPPGKPAYKPLPTGPSQEVLRYRNTLVLIWFGVFGVGTATIFFLPNESKAAPTRPDVLFSPRHYTPATLTAIKECPDPDTRLITLALPPQAVPDSQESIYNPIWSVYIKDDDIQVERPYTPLEGIDERGRMRFWVKKYEKGEVGRWLHSKKMGNKIELRGPLSTWLWDDNKWDEVVMISGGTGITPFYQLLHAKLLKDPTKVPTKTRFTLLHAARKPSELPPPDMLEPLLSASQAHPDRLQMSLFVDSSEGPVHPNALGSDNARSWWRSLFSRSSSPNVNEKKYCSWSVGPNRTMITAIAGPYGRNFSQGVVGGVLGELGYKNHQVWKL
ncbi:uncharacterized protein B0H18DRAFT_966255 [Fomitopsis serialis]|uniref:uncharacterized protein n=1 Tax=Fomitopsis serialis TaxID=139415 RepID=UPI0020080CEE|nr:uncharacterized protein B0H18DRAFT_966255 [Neoantrodia serialis]KAH9938254.1 hypothetical protein B0H18DRAFT_966255 [Neoantrodia serialis]